MKNLILSTKNIDDLIDELAQRVVNRLKEEHFNESELLIKKQDSDPLSIQEASKFLNLSVATIYSKISRGELPVNKRGKKLYFLKEELFEYIKAGRRPSNSEILSGTQSLRNKKGDNHG